MYSLDVSSEAVGGGEDPAVGDKRPAARVSSIRGNHRHLPGPLPGPRRLPAHDPLIHRLQQYQTYIFRSITTFMLVTNDIQFFIPARIFFKPDVFDTKNRLKQNGVARLHPIFQTHLVICTITFLFLDETDFVKNLTEIRNWAVILMC